MFSLTIREQFTIAAVFCAVVMGVAVKHWRDHQREAVSVEVTSAGAGAAKPSSVP